MSLLIALFACSFCENRWGDGIAATAADAAAAAVSDAAAAAAAVVLQAAQIPFCCLYLSKR